VEVLEGSLEGLVEDLVVVLEAAMLVRGQVPGAKEIVEDQEQVLGEVLEHQAVVVVGPEVRGALQQARIVAEALQGQGLLILLLGDL
jgi:hypothetical protein